jgi:hypothetical protein
MNFTLSESESYCGRSSSAISTGKQIPAIVGEACHKTGPGPSAARKLTCRKPSLLTVLVFSQDDIGLGGELDLLQWPRPGIRVTVTQRLLPASPPVGRTRARPSCRLGGGPT